MKSQNIVETHEAFEHDKRNSTWKSQQFVCRLHSMRKNCREYRYNKKFCKGCPHNVVKNHFEQSTCKSIVDNFVQSIERNV
jgi:hypothetical protein